MSRQLKGNNAIQIQFSGTPINEQYPGFGLTGAEKPRKNARQKTSNPFPVNNNAQNNRAFMRGFFEWNAKRPPLRFPNGENYETNPRPLMMSGLG